MQIFGLGKKDSNNATTSGDNDLFQEAVELGQIALDIIETNDSIIIFAPIAGVELEEIDLVLNKNVLTIKGERLKPREYFDEDNKIRNSECFWGKFSRNIILPENLDFEAIKAVMENNLLKVTFPKIHIESQNIKINRIGENF